MVLNISYVKKAVITAFFLFLSHKVPDAYWAYESKIHEIDGDQVVKQMIQARHFLYILLHVLYKQPEKEPVAYIQSL